MEKVKRNRAKTIERIVNALEEVLTEYGMEGIGINRVAEKAGVSKVLIYRYFGGLPGLMVYYVKMGKLFPSFTPTILEQIRPVYKTDLARVWYRHVIQTFRFLQTLKAAREVLKAPLIENDSAADATSRALDEELTRLVNQLSFIEAADSEAISAVIIGAMVHLTLLAQHNHTMIGIDLRSEEGWQRVEKAVKLIYMALNKMAIQSLKHG